MSERMQAGLRHALWLLSVLALCTGWTARAEAEVLLSYTAVDSASALSADSDTLAPGVTATPVTRGSGLAPVTLGDDSFASAGWTVGGNRAVAEAEGSYLSWSFEADSSLAMTSLELGFRRGGHAPEQFQLEVSTDGGTSWIVLHSEHVRNASSQQITLDLAAQGLAEASAFEFRFYAWNARRRGGNNNPGSVRLENTVTAPGGGAERAIMVEATTAVANDPDDDPTSPHFCATPAPGASVFLESDVPSGAFSEDFANPTPVPPGNDLVAGTGQANAHDMLVLTDLPIGAQTLQLDFCYPDGSPANFWAGGSVYFKTSPFDWNWNGTPAGNFALAPSTPTDSVTIDLGSDFEGTLYLALYFTYGSEIAWNLGLPAGTSPAALETAKSVSIHSQDGSDCSDLSAGAPIDAQAAIPGACVEYRIDTVNTGGSAAEELRIIDTLSPELIFVAASHTGFDTDAPEFFFSTPPANADCGGGACEITMENAALPAGEAGQIVIRTIMK